MDALLPTVENCKPSILPLETVPVEEEDDDKVLLVQLARRGRRRLRVCSEEWTAFGEVFNGWFVMKRGAPISLSTNHQNSDHRISSDELASLNRRAVHAIRSEFWYLSTLSQKGKRTKLFTTVRGVRCHFACRWLMKSWSIKLVRTLQNSMVGWWPLRTWWSWRARRSNISGQPNATRIERLVTLLAIIIELLAWLARWNLHHRLQKDGFTEFIVRLVFSRVFHLSSRAIPRFSVACHHGLDSCADFDGWASANPVLHEGFWKGCAVCNFVALRARVPSIADVLLGFCSLC